LTSNIEEKNNTNWVKVFPNPVQRSLTIRIDKPYSKIKVEIIDEKGSILYKKETLDGSIILNDQTPGMYFVKLLVDNELITKKVLVK